MQILDTTIRDGSYSVDFKFSCDDVQEIIGKLETLGLEYIEIGHGMGLNASSPEHGISLHTDIEYMDTANRTLKKSKFGFFCIPGIARIEDLHIAKQHGVSFVRVGVNATQPNDAIDYVIEAKKLGLQVMVNYMKTYLVTPHEFSANARMAEDCGADYVYLVDSAGSMLPEELGEYYDEVRKTSKIKLGFHGHNNLGLAVANSIYCAQKGFDMIDCSLQGIGRSLGNASTEQVVMLLQRLGYPIDIDIPKLLEYGYVLLRDISPKDLQNPLDLVCGYAGFHSGFLKDIYHCCMEKKVDPLRLIIAYSARNRQNIDYEQLCEVADTLPRDLENHPYKFGAYFSPLFSS